MLVLPNTLLKKNTFQKKLWQTTHTKIDKSPEYVKKNITHRHIGIRSYFN